MMMMMMMTGSMVLWRIENDEVGENCGVQISVHDEDNEEEGEILVDQVGIQTPGRRRRCMMMIMMTRKSQRK